jgi:5'-3' exonuclease
MAIYLDFSGSMFAALHVDLKAGEKPDLDYLRYLIINNIRFYNKKFSSEFGLMHICLDSSSWRDGVFPQYKYERRANRAEDNNDWDQIFDHISTIQSEIKEHLPFPVIQAVGAEADDIIGVLCSSNTEPSILVSNDKDFGALLKHKHVKRYRPIVKGVEKTPITDPERFEFDLILSGDKSDGIPSVRCHDDFYIEQHRAKLAKEPIVRAPPVSAKLKNSCYEAFNKSQQELEIVMGKFLYKNYLRNQLLISLDYVPDDVKVAIHKSVHEASPAKIMKTLQFLMQNRMQRLVAEIKDFTPNQTPRKVTSVFDI